jgi:hypothetical protein
MEYRERARVVGLDLLKHLGPFAAEMVARSIVGQSAVSDGVLTPDPNK